MPIQDILIRLSPLIVLTNRDLIPSFSSTLISSPNTPIKEIPWRYRISPETDLHPLNPSQLFAQKRVVIFGEQHVQPKVLAAQLIILKSLHEHASQNGKKVSMVLEHFNILQQNLLDKFSQDSISEDDFRHEYSKSQEGFDLKHYLPLLQLARELSIPIIGGFPPREWASIVFRESISSLQQHAQFSPEIPQAFAEDGRWDQVETMHAKQVSYLRSMLSGNPPILPLEEKDRPTTIDGKYEKGIMPAQSLKDSFFAWSIDEQLTEDPKKIVYGVCGLGHAEYGLNATARLKHCEAGQVLIVASKPWEMLEFVGKKTDIGGECGDRLADVVIPYEVDQK